MRTILTFLLIIFSLTAYGKEPISVKDIKDVIESTSKSINEVKTYQFLLIKRETIEGKDTGHQYLMAKVQTEPLKVYIKFLKPARLVGREALYTGRDLLIRRGGTRNPNLVLALDPFSPVAMVGNKYPITHMNPKTLCTQLIEKVEKEIQFPDTKLYKTEASYAKQPGIHYRLIHKSQHPDMECCMAEMLISKKHNLPIYFKVVNWGNKVIEEYAFSMVKVNEALPVDTFNEDNPEYHFKRKDDEK